jgi:hypothetical protein
MMNRIRDQSSDDDINLDQCGFDWNYGANAGN